MEGIFTVALNFATFLLIVAVIMLPIAALAYLAAIYKSLRRIEARLAVRPAGMNSL